MFSVVSRPVYEFRSRVKMFYFCLLSIPISSRGQPEVIPRVIMFYFYQKQLYYYTRKVCWLMAIRSDCATRVKYDISTRPSRDHVPRKGKTQHLKVCANVEMLKVKSKQHRIWIFRMSMFFRKVHTFDFLPFLRTCGKSIVRWRSGWSRNGRLNGRELDG